MKRSLLLGCISLFVVAVFAQEDPVLMRVNGREVLRSEFENAYRRYAERSNARLSRSIKVEGGGSQGCRA